MSIRKKEMSNFMMALHAFAFVANLAHESAQIKADVLDLKTTLMEYELTTANPAMGYIVAAQAMAMAESPEMVTLTRGAVWEEAQPTTYVNVSLENMEQEKEFAQEIAEDLERVGDLEEAVEKLVEDMSEPAIEPIIDSDRLDAELATAAIEELTVKLENAISEQAKEAEQETAALRKEFKDEQDELVGKLDKMRDKYFKNHPDLPADQRTDAEETFKTIKDEAIGELKTQQDSRLVELQGQQQDLSDNYAQAKKESDETRDERD
jgi:hypothetical protein